MKQNREKIVLTTAHRGGGKSTTFSGRSEGKDVRSNLRLDSIDNNGKEYVIEMPSDTTSFNPSFFLGLFFESIKRLGIEGFKDKYKISLSNMSANLKVIIQDNLDECMRKASNEYNDLTGLD